ncbi:MAG: TolC family protein [Gemmatimonadota bacterium]
MVLAIMAVTVLAAQDTLVVDLRSAAARAVAASPVVAAAVGAVRQPWGIRAEVSWPFPDNPVLEYGRVRRRTGLSTALDREWSVSQELEVAGQWVFRRSAAGALIRSAEARVDDARRLVGLEVRRAYAALAVDERRAALTDSAAVFAERLAVFARRQFDAGESNRLEWNAAVIEAARARSAAERARAGAQAAAADLARLLALPADTALRTAGLPAMPDVSWPSDSVLLAMAEARRPDLEAARAAREGAARFVTATRLSRVPNLTVTALGGREAGTDNLLGVAVGVRVPLFHRQQAGLGAARAADAAAVAGEVAALRGVRTEVLSAAARFARTRAAEQRFASDVLRAATENVALTERALAEGEVSVSDVLVLRGAAVAAQLEYLEVMGEVAGAWFELAAALAVEPDGLPGLLRGGN